MGKSKKKGFSGGKNIPSFLRAENSQITGNKRAKTGDEAIDNKSKVKITEEMFEAARLMKGGVSHIDQLDMKVVKEQ
jgi:hypothetical protein